MIVRFWRGWTTPENEPRYQDVLQNHVMPGIKERQIKGLRGWHLTKRPITGDNREPEIEFCTVMWWDSVDAIKAFVGEDYEVAHVPDIAKAVLKRFDQRVRHNEVFEAQELIWATGPNAFHP